MCRSTSFEGASMIFERQIGATLFTRDVHAPLTDEGRWLFRHRAHGGLRSICLRAGNSVTNTLRASPGRYHRRLGTFWLPLALSVSASFRTFSVDLHCAMRFRPMYQA